MQCFGKRLIGEKFRCLPGRRRASPQLRRGEFERHDDTAMAEAFEIVPLALDGGHRPVLTLSGLKM
jgi:hypothetical protein